MLLIAAGDVRERVITEGQKEGVSLRICKVTTFYSAKIQKLHCQNITRVIFSQFYNFIGTKCPKSRIIWL